MKDKTLLSFYLLVFTTTLFSQVAGAVTLLDRQLLNPTNGDVISKNSEGILKPFPVLEKQTGSGLLYYELNILDSNRPPRTYRFTKKRTESDKYEVCIHGSLLDEREINRTSS